MQGVMEGGLVPVPVPVSELEVKPSLASPDNDEVVVVSAEPGWFEQLHLVEVKVYDAPAMDQPPSTVSRLSQHDSMNA